MTQKTFKIYTEDKEKTWIKELLSNTFSGCTILYALGLWRGKEENALCIEIITHNKSLVKEVSQKIKRHNQQATVLYTEIQTEVNSV